jgi:phosphate transport system substrate-binding protein
MKRKEKILKWTGWGIVFSAIFLLGACGDGTKVKEVDTPTSGSIRVGIDDSYTLLAEAQVYAFEALYQNTRLDTVFRSEADVINDFMNDSVALIIVNRKLSDNEEQYLKERQFNPRTTKVAIDAIAVILNKENPDSNLLFRDIRGILEGKITRWNQINPASKLGEIRMVFDNMKSGNPRYFKDRFNITTFPSSCSAARDNKELISYIEKNKNAIGLISVNWISDPQDTVSHGFLSRFKVAALSIEGDNDRNTSYYRPYPAYIADGSYPFTRDVYCINRQTYSGLAYGFSSFIAGEKGQYIVLHSGLVPAAMPVRVVQLKN